MIVTPGEPDVTTPCGETPATPRLVEDHLTSSSSVDWAIDRWARFLEPRRGRGWPRRRDGL